MKRRIAGYEVLEQLGQGGMGAVYRARDLQLDREVALKTLLPGLANEQVVARFLREGQALARIRHPLVIQVHEADMSEDGLPYLVMELVLGSSLQERLDREGPLEVGEALELVSQLSEAVEACHAANVLHRDIKPDNVLVTAAGGLRLIDFGLARDADPSLSRTRLTQSGRAVGTPGFWAPEQAKGKLDQIGPPTDVHGLGALLYALLTARPPYQAERLIDVLAALEHGPRPPSRLRPGLPPAVDRLCLRCLSSDPARRFATAGVLRAALGDLRAAQGSSRPTSSRRRLGVLLSLLALAIVAYVVIPRPNLDEVSLRTLSREVRELEDELWGAVPPLTSDDWPDEPTVDGLAHRLASLEVLAQVDDEAVLDPSLDALALLRWQRARRAGRDDEARYLALALSDPVLTQAAEQVAAWQRGERLDLSLLEALREASRPQVRHAARVLLADACATQDPARARSLLEEGPEQPIPAETARLLEAVTALDELRVDDFAAQAEGLSEHRRRALRRRSLEQLAPRLRRDADQLLAALRILAHTADAAREPNPLADEALRRISGRLEDLPASESYPEVAAGLAPLLDALARSGLGLTDYRPADQFVSQLHSARAFGSLDAATHEAFALALTRLDVVLTPVSLNALSEGHARWDDSPAGELLRLLCALGTDGGTPVTRAGLRRFLREDPRAASLGPRVRAAALWLTIHQAMPHAEAVELLEEALALDPENGWVLVQLALARGLAGRELEAVELGERALRAYDAGRVTGIEAFNKWVFQADLIEIHARFGQPERARELFADAVQQSMTTGEVLERYRLRMEDWIAARR